MQADYFTLEHKAGKWTWWAVVNIADGEAMFEYSGPFDTEAEAFADVKYKEG